MKEATQTISIKMPNLSIIHDGKQFFLSFNIVDYDGLTDKKPSIGRPGEAPWRGPLAGALGGGPWQGLKTPCQFIVSDSESS
jgi:hypothetical protein